MNCFRFLSLVLATGTVFAGTVFAQPRAAKGKSSADIAVKTFTDFRDNGYISPTPAHFTDIINSGLSFLAQFPTHDRAGIVIKSLATFHTTIRDNKQQELRASWLASLQNEIARQGGDEQMGEDAQVVFKALDAALAGTVLREAMNRDNLKAFRDKIDRLAELSGSSRYLVEQEQSFLEVLTLVNPASAEKQARVLLAHPDKKVASMARDELNLIEMRKQPLELKFSTLDGQQIDSTQMRGKVLYFVFWSTTNEKSLQELDNIKSLYKPAKKIGVEIITVAQDTDKDVVAKFVKSKRYVFPVIFDGQGGKDEFSMKLNAHKLPASAIYDQKGMLAYSNVPSDKLDVAVMKLGVKSN